MKVWQCSVCKYIHRGDAPPEKCPVCGVDASKFVEIDEAAIPVKKPRPIPSEKPKQPLKTEAEKTPVLPQKVTPPPQPKTGFEKMASLLVKHHAHPVSVHTPNGILPVAVLLFILAWLFDTPLLYQVAFVNLIFVILSLPLVIFTGILEWKRKYNGAMTLIFKLKILAASLTAASCIISLVWCLLDPGIIGSSRAWVFLLINLVGLMAAGIAGHIGGKLVFKD